MLQTKYSREEEESNNEERNWEGKWKIFSLEGRRQRVIERDRMWKFSPQETFALAFETCISR